MSRLGHFDLDTMPSDVAALMRERPPANLFRILPHAPGAVCGFLAFGDGLRTQSDLDPRLRELVILRVGAISRAAYEIHHHKQVGRTRGLTESDIAAALREGPDDDLDEFERLVLKFTDAVVLEVKAPASLYDAVALNLTERQMMELVLSIGYYTMICRVVENFELEMEPPGAMESWSTPV